MNLTAYGATFKEEAVGKALIRCTCTEADMAGELNVSLKNWVRSRCMVSIRGLPASEWLAG